MGQLVGCIGLKYEEDYQGLIGKFGVDSSVRRQGLGTRLMESVIGYARDNNFKILTLKTSPKQHGMFIYKRLGFVTVGYDDSDGDDVMELKL